MIARYARSEASVLWSDAYRFEVWLRVELAVCQAMEDEGIVPRGTATTIRAAASIRPERVVEIEATTRHDVIAFLTHIEELCPDAGRWLHLGMTSSDVLDTSYALQMREALDLLLSGIDGLREVLARRALEHRRTAMIGRTHGMVAEPMTAGLVFLRSWDELGRCKDRLLRARETISVGKIAGAIGLYGGVLTPEMEERVLTSLGLRPELVASQVVARDRHAEVFQVLALCAVAIERLALQVRHWQRSEVGEAEEAFATGQKGSSAMPHKRNPILSENLCGLARLVRAYADGAMENVALWHERDISHSSFERVAGPDATILLDFMLDRARRLVDGLMVHAKQMQANLQSAGELVFSEAVLTALIRAGLGRQEAYEIVQRHAMQHLQGATTFRKSLEQDAEVRARLAPDNLAGCFDLQRHLSHVDAIYSRTLGA